MLSNIAGIEMLNLAKIRRVSVFTRNWNKKPSQPLLNENNIILMNIVGTVKYAIVLSSKPPFDLKANIFPTLIL